MHLKVLTAAALVAAVSLGPVAPALADGAASTRNIIIGAGAAALIITNVNKKKHIKQAEQREQARRQASYRSSYYSSHGRYPTDAQSRSWYQRTYGVNPS